MARQLVLGSFPIDVRKFIERGGNVFLIAHHEFAGRDQDQLCAERIRFDHLAFEILGPFLLLGLRGRFAERGLEQFGGRPIGSSRPRRDREERADGNCQETTMHQTR